jgi:signal transduction histidine kinase
MSRASDQSEGRIRRLLLIAAVVPIALAALAGAWFVWQVEELARAAAWIDSSDRVIALVSDVQRMTVDRELALRAFIVTGDERALEQYRRVDAEEDLDELEGLVAGQPAQVQETIALRAVYRVWQEEAEQAVAGGTSLRSIDALRARKASIDALRARGAALVAEQKDRRLESTRRFEHHARMTTVSGVALLALLAGAASLSARRRIRRFAALAARERDALHKAREALRAKDAFLTNLSHELRTPLTPILVLSSMIRARRLQGDALERAVSLIERNARTEAQIVDDVLDIARISSGQLRIAPEAVDPGAVVRAAVDVVAHSARAKGIALDVGVAEALPAVVGDPARLQQVAFILVGNALKFTPRGGHVEVRVDRCDGGVRLRVRDDGEGITRDFLPHVFDDFRQADTSMKRAHGGLGLGLAIARHLVELHGGEVIAESDGPGRGATFTVTLPVAAPAAT